MSYISGRTERLLPARSVWTTSMLWWHAGFYAALASVSYFALFGDGRDSATPLVIGSLLLLGIAYPFLTRTRDLRTARPTIYVALLVTVVVLLSFVYDGAGVLLFVAFPQVWMFTGTQRQGVAATALLCVGVAVGQVSRWGLSGTEVYGITAQLVTSFVASCMIGLWISKVIEQSEQRAELLAELDATRHELDVAEQARGALAERERMAREIHDTLAQGFTSIAMLSEAAQAQLRTQPQDPTGLLRSLSAISQTARESLAEARALVASGVPSDVQGGDLLAALRRLPDTLHLDSMRLNVTLPDRLPPAPVHAASCPPSDGPGSTKQCPEAFRSDNRGAGRGRPGRRSTFAVTSSSGGTRLVAVVPTAGPAALASGSQRDEAAAQEPSDADLRPRSHTPGAGA